MDWTRFRSAYDIDLASETTAAKVLRLVGTGKKVLEVGCGPGHMSQILKEQLGCEVTGVEIDPEAAQVAESFCRRVLVGDLDVLDLTASLDPGAFDVVLLADVLEHLKDPARTLRHARALLTPDGAVVLSVPNLGYIGLLAELLWGRFAYRDKGLLDATHLRFFTRQGLESLLGQEGFAVEAWDSYTAPVEHSEFNPAYLSALPETVRNYLRNLPEAATYQFVVRARPSDTGAPEAPPPSPAPQGEDAQRALEGLRGRLNAAEAELSLMRQSRSWRLTEPLRRLARLLRG